MLLWIKSSFKKLVREGSLHRSLVKSLCDQEFATQAYLAEYQNHKLQAMVQHCYRNVPYYRELFDSLGLKPQDIRSKDDLHLLPVMDKNTVRERTKDLLAQNIPGFLSYATQTSGTLGTPLTLRRDVMAINYEHAFVTRFFQRAGHYGKRRLTMRADRIVSGSRQHAPFWRYDRVNNELSMSSYHFTQAHYRDYVWEILKFQPHTMVTFPINCELMSHYFQQAGATYSFDAIFTSSENLKPEVRALAEVTFQCRIYDWYGQAERVAALGQCEYGNYHIEEDYSIVELLPQADGGAELVGTHLHNLAMPLLRYKMGDTVYPSGEPCRCGRHFRTVECIAGRVPGYILSPEGDKLPYINIFLKASANLIEAQSVQERPGELIVNVVTNPYFSQTDEQAIIRCAQDYISPRLNVQINRVSSIPRGPNGKFKPIINRVLEREAVG